MLELDLGHEARDFLSGFSAEDLAQDRMRALSIVKCIEIIGEAVSDGTTYKATQRG